MTEQQIKLHTEKYAIMERGVLIIVYRNAEGYLWGAETATGGTALGYSEYASDNPNMGAFASYDAALEHAVKVCAKFGLREFQRSQPDNKFHWSNYVQWAIEQYRKNDLTQPPCK